MTPTIYEKANEKINQLFTNLNKLGFSEIEKQKINDHKKVFTRIIYFLQKQREQEKQEEEKYK